MPNRFDIHNFVYNALNLKKTWKRGYSVPRVIDPKLFKIENAKEADRLEMVNIRKHAFGNENHFIFGAADWNLSKKLTYEGQIVGYYLLAEESIYDVLAWSTDYAKGLIKNNMVNLTPEEELVVKMNKKYDTVKVYEDIRPYKGKRGLEGVSLGIAPEFQGYGAGNALKNVPKGMPYDYIWGMQYKHLGNLEDWLKRRRLIAESYGLYYTLEDLR